MLTHSETPPKHRTRAAYQMVWTETIIPDTLFPFQYLVISDNPFSLSSPQKLSSPRQERLWDFLTFLGDFCWATKNPFLGQKLFVQPFFSFKELHFDVQLNRNSVTGGKGKFGIQQSHLCLVGYGEEELCCPLSKCQHLLIVTPSHPAEQKELCPWWQRWQRKGWQYVLVSSNIWASSDSETKNDCLKMPEIQN